MSLISVFFKIKEGDGSPARCFGDMKLNNVLNKILQSKNIKIIQNYGIPSQFFDLISKVL